MSTTASPSILKPKTLQRRILQWFDQHGRKTLPWQNDKTAYRIWISEIMLQQTQVATVIPYYQRFIARFPNIAALAAATEDDILHYWTGLGYYSRARNILRTAKYIVLEHNGKFPADSMALQALPGIGRSTAGAICAIAFQKKAAILDGNVKRVLIRLHGIRQWSGDVLPLLWQLAENYTPDKRVGDYTQAMMDIGAMLCTRRKPQCLQCPLKTDCLAYQQTLTDQLPISKPRKSLPIKRSTALILRHHHQVLLIKRPSSGIWGGLWSFPELAGFVSMAAAKKYCLQQYAYQAKQVKKSQPFRHTFSHFHLDILPIFLSNNIAAVDHIESKQKIWYNIQDSQIIGLPGPVAKILQAMQKEL